MNDFGIFVISRLYERTKSGGAEKAGVGAIGAVVQANKCNTFLDIFRPECVLIPQINSEPVATSSDTY